MAIWSLNLVLLISTGITALEAGWGPTSCAWLGWVTATILAYPMSRRLEEVAGWMYVLLAISGATLAVELHDGNLNWWGAAMGAIFAGSAAGLGTHVGRQRLYVPATAIAALFLAIQSLIIAFAGQPTARMVFVVACLVGGFLLGYVFRAIGEHDDMDSDDPARLLALGREALGSFNLARARRLLQRAAQLSPSDVAIKRAHYAAWKYHPFSPRFHEVAAELLAVDDDELVARYYKDYLAVTQVRPDLPPELHLQLAHRFAAAGDPDEAARIVNLHLQRDQSIPGLPAGLLATLQGYLAADNHSKAARYADTLVAFYPDSTEARSARGILENLVGESR